MSAASIGSAKGPGYARYLESKTVAPERGDYYLSPGGEPTQAPGRWLSTPDTLARLGIEGEAIDGSEFIALMEGKHPRSGDWLRPEGAGGGRGGGIDVTFSAPKSVSTLWALGGPEERRELEAAHGRAVEKAINYLGEVVPIVRRRREGVVVEEHARDLVAAEYRHTTARGVIEGETPDPHMHSHVVITNAVREDGRIVAVASRPVFRQAREVGSYYRSALASELKKRGYEFDLGTGRGGRYFEIAGVPRGLLDAFSTRGREVAHAAERFRAKWGRAPERGELRALKLENRKAKALITQRDLREAWEQTAREQGFGEEERQLALADALGSRPEEKIAQRVERQLTERQATFTYTELRAVALEQSVGQKSPRKALVLAETLVADRQVIELEHGLLTTLTVRAQEQALERRVKQLAKRSERDVGDEARAVASSEVAERIGAELSEEQELALRVITGKERAAVLIGPAGTGKGVVIDAAARAEQQLRQTTIGVAVAGSTAQRLGQDSPALAGNTLTVDALVRRADEARLALDANSTVFFDEAGMADSARLDDLTRVVEESGAKLVLIGDGAQLPSIGPGGMFDRVTPLAPSATLSHVRRTLDKGEQCAWADLRAGRSDRAMAYYQQAGRLHMSDTREHSIERAAQAWAELTQTLAIPEVALISDASNREIARLNARVQHLRGERGELGDTEAQLPGLHYGIREGDRVVLVDQHHTPGEARVENGTQGWALAVEPGRVLVKFDVTDREHTLLGDELARLRLAYAQHIHRAQGATVTRTLVITGGWQTSKEPAYVEASRSRQGTDWYVSREDLGEEGQDSHRIERLAQAMGRTRRQTPSLAHREVDYLDRRDALVRRERSLHSQLMPGLSRAIGALAGAVKVDRSR